MKPKLYNNFEEINTDLKILKLQREIDRENLKLTYQNARSSFYPTNILGGFGGLAKKIAISLFAKKLLKKLS